MDRTSDRPLVTRVARAALRDVSADVGTLERTPLAWLAIARTTADLARYSGTTTDGRTWSAIRKVLRRPEGSNTDDWRREADVYASGLLADLPPGIAAPRVYAIVDGTDEVHLWLEEVIESQTAWSLARYEAAARDLGRFNAAYLVGRPIPAGLKLGRDWLARWAGGAAARSLPVLDDPAFRENELVRMAVSPSTLERVRAVIEARARLLAAMNALPSSLAHLDAWRANLLSRDVDGGTQTVAIDWSLVGAAPAGLEIAVFVTGARVWLGVSGDDATTLGDMSFRAYVAGLRDGAWTGSETDARFAYAAGAALWAVTAAPLWLSWFTIVDRREWLERKFGMPIEHAAEPFGAFIEYAVALGEEALR